MLRALVLIALALAVVSVPDRAVAHGGNPAIALLVSPTCNATVAQGECYNIRWVDSDVPIITGTAAVDLFATQYSPPTFAAGTIPDDLESRSILIATGIREADKTNAFCWDPSNVPPGSYFIWSRMVEPAIEMSISIVSWAPGTLTVVAPGQEPAMTVFVDNPNSPFRFSDDKFMIKWCGRDPPGGTASVKLEATPNRREDENLLFIADGLSATGEFEWNTRCMFEGDWGIKATLTAANGDKFVSWSRYFLLITHPFAPRDAGGLNEGCVVNMDAAFDDAGGELADGGTIKEVTEDCDCSTSTPKYSPAWIIFAVIVLLRLRRG
jgi:hypothetical protein